MKGNEALAEAVLRAGCKCYFGYPITPQTEIAAYMAKNMPRHGGTFLQAESEIAAINMVLGAAAAGIRTMTSSSSPGISLKSEGISYIAASDLPCVIVNVQRGGPGLGGIQPAQSDYWQAVRTGGHGDYHILVFAPNSVQEMADMAVRAFETADKYRIPAMILSDGMLGQMMEPVVLPETSDMMPEKPWATNGHGNKRKHNIINTLFLKPDELEASVLARYEKYRIIEEKEQDAELYLTEDADIIVTAYGAVSRICREAVDQARKMGIRAGLLRPKVLWPFPVNCYEKIAETSGSVLCVELSMGQMIDDVKLAVKCKLPVEFFGRTGGNLPAVGDILEKITAMDKEKK
ncbi:MAG: 3-methyl-2-oxobutanoate dehydrogenase subunit VorB [Porcipelethomonas sp.]